MGPSLIVGLFEEEIPGAMLFGPDDEEAALSWIRELRIHEWQEFTCGGMIAVLDSQKNLGSVRHGV